MERLLLALCTWRGSVALVNIVPHADTNSFIAISWQKSSRSSQQAKVVKQSVSLFNPILHEKTMAQRVVTNSVLHLGQRGANKLQ